MIRVTRVSEAAGLDRLEMQSVGTPIDPTLLIPAPSQGAIGAECQFDFRLI